jgi:BirA family biotin operon repressor/biotin-[acetyl-CoA-carboxylase] ligase
MKPLSPNLTKLVKLLNDNQYHDGTTIGKALKMTRSAVWKTIKKLEAYGFQIESIKGKGYALKESIVLLDPPLIKKKLRLKNNNAEIIIFENIDSTSDYLKHLKPSRHPSICIAESQTKGRGRFGRSWHSPFGQNIYFSLRYAFEKDISELTGLSLVVSLSIIKTLKAYIPECLYVKWPNDIIYQQKKLAGCLLEIQAEGNGISHVIIGIGINVNMQEDDKLITQPWISLREITGKYIDRNELCGQLINHLFDYIQQFEKMGLAFFMDEWHAVDGLMNKNISLKNANQQFHGIAKGINQHGHLVLELANKTLKAFSSGDTTLIKKA